MSSARHALQTMTSTSLELDEKEAITKGSVQKILNEQILNGNHPKQCESQIIDILGGIDSILSTYLDESNDILLRNTQILRLHEVLTTPIPYQQNKNIQDITYINNQMDNNEEGTDFVYIFDIKDSILHSVFSTKNAEKIQHFIDNKIVLMLLIVAAIIGPCLWFGFGDKSLFVNTYGIIVALLWIPWLILKHFSFNKKGFILCLKTFDFWMKICYGMIATVAIIFHGASDYDNNTNDILLIIRECIAGIIAVLFISYFSGFDASNSSKTTKLVISIVAAMFASYLSISVQFFESEEKDYKIRIKLTESVISMQSTFASSCRILAIFIWKQVIKTLIKNGRAVSISRSPQIIWTNCNHHIKNKQNRMNQLYKNDKTERMDTNLDEEEKEEMNTANVMRKPEEKRESMSFSIGDHENSKSI